MPAIFKLIRAGSVTNRFAVVGVARRTPSREAFAEGVAAVLRRLSPAVGEAAAATAFSRTLEYVAGDFADPETYERLRHTLRRVDRERGTEGNRLFYLATPPSE